MYGLYLYMYIENVFIHKQYMHPLCTRIFQYASVLVHMHPSRIRMLQFALICMHMHPYATIYVFMCLRYTCAQQYFTFLLQEQSDRESYKSEMLKLVPRQIGTNPIPYSIYAQIK